MVICGVFKSIWQGETPRSLSKLTAANPKVTKWSAPKTTCKL